MIVAGGYPPALTMPGASRREEWHRDNLESVIRRDILGSFLVRHPGMLARSLDHASASTSGVLNVNGIASGLQATMSTVKRYLGLLEQVFLLERLLPWHRNRLRRLVKSPKLHLGDTGLACVLLNADADMLKLERSLLGRLLETFVHQELRKQASWHDVRLKFCHFRHKERAEVDIVLIGKGGAVAGVEVRAGAAVGPADFRGLKMLAEAAGKKFVRGVVLHDGHACLRYGKTFNAVPIRRLWESAGE